MTRDHDADAERQFWDASDDHLVHAAEKQRNTERAARRA